MADAATKTKPPAQREPAPIADVSIETQFAVERFLFRQSEIIDEGLWGHWLDLFTEDGRYWMPAEEDQETGDGMPNIFWEDRNLMTVRIRRNTHPHAWSQEPQNRLCHVVSNVLIEHEDPKTGDVIVRSRFHCAEYLRYEVRNFTGKYRHHLKKTPAGCRIELQQVDLVNREGPYDYVIQWWL